MMFRPPFFVAPTDWLGPSVTFSVMSGSPRCSPACFFAIVPRLISRARRFNHLDRVRRIGQRGHAGHFKHAQLHGLGCKVNHPSAGVFAGVEPAVSAGIGGFKIQHHPDISLVGRGAGVPQVNVFPITGLEHHDLLDFHRSVGKAQFKVQSVRHHQAVDLFAGHGSFLNDIDFPVPIRRQTHVVIHQLHRRLKHRHTALGHRNPFRHPARPCFARDEPLVRSLMAAIGGLRPTVIGGPETRHRQNYRQQPIPVHLIYFSVSIVSNRLTREAHIPDPSSVESCFQVSARASSFGPDGDSARSQRPWRMGCHLPVHTKVGSSAGVHSGAALKGSFSSEQSFLFLLVLSSSGFKMRPNSRTARQHDNRKTIHR